MTEPDGALGLVDRRVAELHLRAPEAEGKLRTAEAATERLPVTAEAAETTNGGAHSP